MSLILGNSPFSKPTSKAHCRSQTKAAIRDFILVRPKRCEDCREPARVQAAHYNYDEPLIVRWLCPSCHRNWDVAFPKPMKVPANVS